MKTLLLWIASLVLVEITYGQSQLNYRVRLCPGPRFAYDTLVHNLKNVKKPEELPIYLKKWEASAKLKRFQVEIQETSSKKLLVWQKRGDAQPASLASLVSTESTAGRGDGNVSAQPGDNQRCFLQDTTIVLDTLHIRRGDFPTNVQLVLSIAGKTYTLPLSPNGGEWLLSAVILKDVPMGEFQIATVQLGTELARTVVLYLLSTDDRAQLIQSLRDWTSDEVISCRQLTERLINYMIQNWGGKQCASPALYLYAQRAAIQKLLKTEKLTCAP